MINLCIYLVYMYIAAHCIKKQVRCLGSLSQTITVTHRRPCMYSSILTKVLGLRAQASCFKNSYRHQMLIEQAVTKTN